jgi:hypothetical protein
MSMTLEVLSSEVLTASVIRSLMMEAVSTSEMFVNFYQTLMEPHCLMPCSQGPTTGLCPEPDESIPHSHQVLRSILILSLIHIGLRTSLFP